MCDQLQCQCLGLGADRIMVFSKSCKGCKCNDLLNLLMPRVVSFLKNKMKFKKTHTHKKPKNCISRANLW